MPEEIPVFFHSEGISFSLKEEDSVRSWIASVVHDEGASLLNLNYIFCNDDHLYKMNVSYLDHDELTDVITFDNSEKEKSIEGDIFISIDRVRENANEFNMTEEKELMRVMVHGLLHLLGYNDKSTDKKKEMTSKEDLYLKNLA